MNPKKKYSPLENQDGFALISAMIFLVLLTVIGIAANNTGTIETMISASEKNRQSAFFAADAGIEHGKIVIMNALKSEFAKTGATDWDVVLSDSQSGVESYNYKTDDSDEESFIWINNRSMGSAATYKVMARDNDDDDDDVFDDADNIIYLTSIATLTDGTFAGVEIGLSSTVDSGSATGYSAQAGSGSGKSYKSDDANTMTDFTPQTSIDMN
ncbi:pilus assembly PilX N-terminal domain-containing protein [uncultured Desulfobacter sp.]|uniref:pilus assembly PilX family protein n=1 Tax=uncultured Desulfobacter sp. TaxID=240139 RepID=UPI0029F4F5A5|nr:pilus assembly PilX N-terminal domain-containing protein [uncultured Desulfobacter sp.]